MATTTDDHLTDESTEAADAHFGDDYYGRPRFAKILQHIPREGTVLDFGCNEGVFLHLLRKHGRKGLGIDQDPAHVAACRRFGLEAVQADIFEFLYAAENQGKYAGILMADFVEHFDPRPLQDLLARSARLLRPGGVLAIFTPNSRSLTMASGGFYENEIEHHHTYSLSGLRRYLTGHDMEFVAGGPSPESRLPFFTPRPLQMLRRCAFLGLGALLCGKDALYREIYLVMRRSG